MMNKQTILMTLGLMLAVGATAQSRQGGISEQMLTQIRKQQTATASDRALHNAIAANAIDDLAKKPSECR